MRTYGADSEYAAYERRDHSDLDPDPLSEEEQEEMEEEARRICEEEASAAEALRRHEAAMAQQGQAREWVDGLPF